MRKHVLQSDNSYTIHREEQDPGELYMNSLLSCIGFSKHRATRYDNEDAQLLYDDNPDQDIVWGRSNTLWDHPIACRSYAIYPLLDNFIPRLGYGISLYVKGPNNFRGITVWDVQEVLRKM